MAALAVCVLAVVAACGWVVKSGISMVVDAIETGNFSTIGNAPFKQGNGPPYGRCGRGPRRAGPWRRGHLHRGERHRGHCQRAYLLLEQDANYTAVRCRKSGEGMSVAGRAEAANKAGAELFLSIHANYDETARPPALNASRRRLPVKRTSSPCALQGCWPRTCRRGPLRGEAGVRYAFYEDDGSGGIRR